MTLSNFEPLPLNVTAKHSLKSRKIRFVVRLYLHVSRLVILYML